MKKEQYENIMSCIRRRGTVSQRRDAKALTETNGWAITHADTIELMKEVRRWKDAANRFEVLWLKEKGVKD